METTTVKKGTGLFCEGCKHEFLPGELMLMVYEDEQTEIMTAFCNDCLAYELATETAVPEEFGILKPVLLTP